MVTHCPSRLRGPLTQRGEWWQAAPTGPGPRESATIRHELVDRIKAEIAAGTYDTPERLEAAVRVMAKRLHLS
jgi:hypothetical protein